MFTLVLDKATHLKTLSRALKGYQGVHWKNPLSALLQTR